MNNIYIQKGTLSRTKKSTLLENIYWVLLLISLCAKSIYFQYTAELNTGSIFLPKNLIMTLATLCTLTILISLTYILFNRKRHIAFFVLDIILTIILFADTVYFRYYRNPITVPVLLQIGLIGSLGESVSTLTRLKDFLFIIDLPVLLAMMDILRKKGVNSIIFMKRLLIGFTAIAVACTSLYLIYKSNRSIIMFDYDKNYVAKDLGVFYFHAYDADTFARENILVNKSLTHEDRNSLDSFFSNNSKGSQQYKGIAKGKNLIIIQMESIQQFVINRKLNDKEITPNLNNLIKESAYFNNFFYQIGAGNTSDAEFLTNNSLYPAKEGATYFRYYMNTYNSLPRLLKSNGYNTYAFHAYNPSFWNRTNMYKAVGFDTFYSKKDYILDEVEGWSVGDNSFLRQSLEKIDRSKPFYGFFITLSSHFAYGNFEDNLEFDVGSYTGTNLGNYFRAAHYVDTAIGNFIAELKRQGLYENTVLVIYGDHNAMPKPDAGDLLKFLELGESEFDWLSFQKVPYIIHYPGVKNGEAITTTGGQIDTLPTVANLLGIEVPYAIGKDLLNTKEGYAVLRNGSFITDNYIYINSQNKAYDISTGNVLPEDQFLKDFDRFKKELEISDIILEKNAFKSMKK